jgi:hypothetical protein
MLWQALERGRRRDGWGFPASSIFSTSTDFLELDQLTARLAFVSAGYTS